MLKVWKSQTGPVTTPWGHQILQVTATPNSPGRVVLRQVAATLSSGRILPGWLVENQHVGFVKTLAVAENTNTLYPLVN